MFAMLVANCFTFTFCQNYIYKINIFFSDFFITKVALWKIVTLATSQVFKKKTNSPYRGDIFKNYL
jgi:hypothetical protein